MKTPQQIRNEMEKEEMTYRDWMWLFLGIIFGISLTLFWKAWGVIK